MSKLITITGRTGAGKTTIAAIVTEKVSQYGKALLIDNNKNNINIYDIPNITTDDIKPYLLLEKKQSAKALQDIIVQIKKNIYFISANNSSILNIDEINCIKETQAFDYIIVDQKYEETNIEKIEEGYKIIIVINPNEKEQEIYVRSKDNQYITLINRYEDEAEYKPDKEEITIRHSISISNYANGFELQLTVNEEKSINKLIECITGNNTEEKNNFLRWLTKNKKTRDKDEIRGR